MNMYLNHILNIIIMEAMNKCKHYNTYNLIKLLLPCSGPSGFDGSNCSSVFTSKRNCYI